jgi:hypothetical protein
LISCLFFHLANSATKLERRPSEQSLPNVTSPLKRADSRPQLHVFFPVGTPVYQTVEQLPEYLSYSEIHANLSILERTQLEVCFSFILFFFFCVTHFLFFCTFFFIVLFE